MTTVTDPMPTNFEREPRKVDELAALDVDRTLIDTDAVTDLILDSLSVHGINSDHIRVASADVKSKKGGSVDLFGYIEAEFSIDPDDLVEDILANITVSDELKQALLYPGADRLIDALEVEGKPFILFTHGKFKSQDFKIRLIRKLLDRFTHELPALITNTDNKSASIQAEWLDDEGCLKGKAREQLGYLCPASIIMVDDKEDHLDTSNERLAAIWIDNTRATDGAMSVAELAGMLETGTSLVEASQVYSQHRAKRAS